MADDISPVNLPPIASTGDAPPHDSHSGSNDRNKKNKNKDKPKDESSEKIKEIGNSQSGSREKFSPSSVVIFERSELELVSFA
jgi:hypothetical protein